MKEKEVRGIIYLILAFIFTVIGWLSLIFSLLAIYTGYKLIKQKNLKSGYTIMILGIIIIIIPFILGIFSIQNNYPVRNIIQACSMYHGEGFDTWWETHSTKYSKYNLDKQDFENFPFKNGFNKGDIILVTKVNINEVKVGDIIMLKSGVQNPFAHRVMNINEDNENRIFSTIGDNNNVQLRYEQEISEDQIIGKVISRPIFYRGLGWVKLIFYDRYYAPQSRGFCEEN